MPLHSVVRGSARIANAGCACLIGVVLLAACGGGTATTPITPANVSSNATPSPAPTAGATASPAPGSGEVIIGIPAPAAVVCTPAPVSVPVGQRAVLNCTSEGYNGPFTVSLDNPAVASVQLVSGTYTFFYVYGLQAGTATASFASTGGGSGSVGITVTP